MRKTTATGSSATTPAEPDAATSAPDESEPRPERQDTLRKQYEQNVAAHRSPYAGVRIQSLGELRWILRERDWSGEMDAGGRDRPNLDEADLRGANLARVQLCHASLKHASLDGVSFHGANLYRAVLFDARCEQTNFREANVFGADLGSAWLWDADFRDACLNRVSFTGTHFRGADLRGAELTAAWMDSTTRFRVVKIDSRTRVAEVVWNGVPLVQVDWAQMPTIGEELAIAASAGRTERIRCIVAAMQAYDALGVVLQSQGVKEWATRYHLRALRLERQAQLLRGHVLSWLLSWLIDTLSGYGQYAGRALRAYVLVVTSFTVAYYVLTNYLGAYLPSQSARLQWIEAAVLSISSFHGRGFFPQSISLGDPVAVLAAAEAVVGLFIELVFITTFSRRFLDR